MVNVDCGAEWTVDNPATDLFQTVCNGDAGTLTITAGQNSVEEEQSATLVLLTANQRIEFATIVVTQNAYGYPEISVETAEWHAPAVGELTTEIAVDSSLDDFTVETSDSWLTAENTGASVTLTVAENTETEARTATVTLTASDGVKSDSATIEVTQDGKAYVTLSADSYTAQGFGGKLDIEIESNFDLEYSTEADWVTVESADGETTVTISANETGDVRQTVVRFTASDGAENTAEADLTITQLVATASLVLTYTTSEESTLVYLPLAGTVDCAVDWGDGSDLEYVTEVNPSHVYTSAGEYDVTVSGTVTGISYEGITTNKARNTTLTAVKQWGDTGLTDMYWAFAYCTSLASIPGDTEDVKAFANVRDFSYAFSYTAITSIPEDLFAYATEARYFADTFWYCENVTSVPENLFAAATEATIFSQVFRECYSLSSIPAGLFAANTKAEQFDIAFLGCPITEIPEELFANNTAAMTFSECFEICEDLEEIPEDLFKYNTEVLSYHGTFYGCTSLSEIPANLFQSASKCTDFSMCFMLCYGLTSIPTGLFDTCTAAQDMQFLFAYDFMIMSVPSSLFYNCPNVTTFNGVFGLLMFMSSFDGFFMSFSSDMFKNCTVVEDFSQVFSYTAISSVPEKVFSYSSKVTDYLGVFMGCGDLESVPPSLFASNPNAAGFAYAFQDCESLESIPSNIFDSNLMIDDVEGTFDGCDCLECESPYTEVNGTKVHLYERNSYSDTFATIVFYDDCFSGCTSLTDYYSIPRSWGGGASTSSVKRTSLNELISIKSEPARILDKVDLLANVKDKSKLPVSYMNRNSK